jgi:arsenite-transporting ATPase
VALATQLFVLTGKGGVGKTTTALALAKSLTLQGKKVLYNSFDQEANSTICSKLKIPQLILKRDESVENYIERKLSSRLVASWIMKTPFFSSLLNMVPGLGHLILLGDIIDRLEKDPELCIILDSPSSGHALTMFESSHNFKRIFGNGPLVKDINKMHDLIFKGEFLKTFIICLPSLMALNEGAELIESINKLGMSNCELILNESLHLSPEVLENKNSELPHFLKTKLSLENEVYKQFSEDIFHKLPLLSNTEMEETVSQLCEYMGELT